MIAVRPYELFQIEVSNYCSLTCAYCPHPTQKRPKGFMSFETFTKCVELIKRATNTPKTIYLHNFGEVLLHPELERLIAYARGEGVLCSFFTNGVDMDGRLFPRSKWRSLADAGLEFIHFSAHKIPEARFREHVAGIVEVRDVYTPLRERRHSWVGQVSDVSLTKILTKEDIERNERLKAQPCRFERDNSFVVQWTGKVSTCCFDIEGQRGGVTVDTILEHGYQFEAIPLCNGCSMGR